MNIVWEAIVLGIIQGLTEFLPVSSSGHLEIAKYILGNEGTGKQGLIMTVILHFATACATIFVFRKEILQLVVEGFSLKANDSNRYILYVIVSMIPAVLVGIFFEEAIESLFSQNLMLVGVALLITAVLLIVADRTKHTSRPVDGWSALLIGLSQAIAILPGISRSGATISTSVLLKIDRQRAARFSFLMVVPLIFGKIAKDLLTGEWQAVEQVTPLVVGFIAAFFTGILACIWMIELVKRARLRYFGWYCALAGLLCILWVNGIFAHA
ncbi:MAG: undecaprenyl-diphosphate phosphatase [Saprospiraceae bacterium]|nr:undecaprenyl-diphosphate phosphatase [Saprospiraceae bacterium]